MDAIFLSLKHACARVTKLAAATAQAHTGLHGAQAPALLMLSIHGGRKISELARDLEIGKPAATTLVNRMEKAGLVKRRPDKDDARASVIELAGRGRCIADDVAIMIGNFDAALIEGFSAREIETIRRFLVRASGIAVL